MRHHHPVCTRAHQAAALLLVASTFLLTRLFDRLLLLDTSASPPTFAGAGWSADLRIYVYSEDEIDGLPALLRGRDGTVPTATCLKGQWGTQVKIHQLLLNSRFRTFNKDEANLFFVPSYVKCVRMTGALNDKEINQTYVKVLSQMPYFRRSGGRDHIFVFPSLMHVRYNQSRYPRGSTWQTSLDVPREKQGVFNWWSLQSKLKLSGPNKLGRIDYFKHLRNAKFCLAPRGESSWTLRFYESFFVVSSPLFLGPPPPPTIAKRRLFQCNVIDYSEISIKWPSSRIGPELLGYLESIPGEKYHLCSVYDERVEEMIGRGREMRCMWVYAVDTEPCSAMAGILWELRRKVRRFHQSAETFWLHNGSMVNRDLVEFHSWRTPVQLP
ncbi:hypothetical protein PR202_gb13795 [Eleusine coracana subsp. coracana]|uniref:Exostosin GT47 domain-containing protein n=1 Tax=Eleusine coracana subsp. coracana TaxID=191504 RepID=A0AAV5ETS7_ELECO|nr:hypothetical protein PR202_gb13795 [Eleusine coracana subsp. coracana]